MDNVVITLRYEGREADIVLPVELPISFLGPILVESLHWPAPDNEDSIMVFQARAVDSGVIVRPAETLANAGIVDGQILELMLVRQEDRIGGDTSTRPDISPHSPYLQCVATGRIFPCSGRHTLVGRGRQCGVDLSELPDSDVVSRTHANIVRRRDGFRIRDTRSSNGTIVDGYMLRSGETMRLRHHSQIRFGEDGPLLVFHAGS